MSHDEKDAIRKKVSESYAQAVQRGGGCCSVPEPKSATTCCGGPAPEPPPPTATSCCSPKAEAGGGVAGKANYDPAQLATLPEDAVESSFGCGDPVAFAEVQEGQTVLDLGSGAGIDLLLAARKVGPTGKVIGVDMTDAMIERARANIAAEGLGNVEVRKGLIEELPVEDGTVDWVISNCVINLSPDKPRVFAEISRVLAPGGRIAVSDMVAESLPQEVLDHPGLYCACISGAVSEADYVAGMKAAGLAEVEVRGRLVYDADQISAFLTSEDCPIGEEPLTPEAVERYSKEMAGKVWSARFHARKP